MVWFTGEAIAAWRAAPRTTRGGQARYLGLPIATALTIRAVFRLALRQTEGLIGSLSQRRACNTTCLPQSVSFLCGRPCAWL